MTFTVDALGDDVSKLYVARYFPPETKAAADKLVHNLIAAMDRRIDQLEWMSPETKAKAHAKLAAFTPKIGYPSQWREHERAGHQARRPRRQCDALARASSTPISSASSAGRSAAGSGA